jgi:hypothetical protein
MLLDHVTKTWPLYLKLAQDGGTNQLPRLQWYRSAACWLL